MTNSDGFTSDDGLREIGELEALLRRIGCSLVVLGYNMPPTLTVTRLARVCEQSIEGGFLDNPTE
jgi:hypothetical protein